MGGNRGKEVALISGSYGRYAYIARNPLLVRRLSPPLAAAILLVLSVLLLLILLLLLLLLLLLPPPAFPSPTSS
jgi:polyferredoxin